MIRLVDGTNLETLGYSYSDRERAAALFSLVFTKKLWSDTAYGAPPETLKDMDEIIERVHPEIDGELDWISPHVHAVVKTFLPNTVQFYFGVDEGLLEGLCQRLGVETHELTTHAVTARLMLAEADIELQALPPSPVN